MVDRGVAAPSEGKISLFWVNGKAMIRRFSYGATAGVVALQALDPSVSPIDVPTGLLVCMGLVWRVVADPNG